MTLPLQGVKIIDNTAYLAGGYIGTLLGDLGADIIKIERPAGDPLRGYFQVFGVSTAMPDGGSVQYESANRNKRGIVLDLTTKKGVEIVYKMIETADVFTTNTRTASLKKHKLDYETLSKMNPDLIYAWGGGFGPVGPDKDRPAIEPIALAKSGTMMAMGPPGQGPAYNTNALADRIFSIMTGYAILTALFAREKHGVGGQKIDVSMIGSLNDLNHMGLEISSITGNRLPRQSREAANNPLYNWYKCKDGVYVIFALMEGNRYWPSFCRALGVTELENDPRFSDDFKRQENKIEFIKIIDKVIATKSYEEWEPELLKEDLLFSRVNTFNEVLEDPQFIENEYVVDFDHPKFGTVKLIPPCFKFSKTPGSIRIPAPELGQHTEEVLLEYGYTWEQISELKDEGVIN